MRVMALTGQVLLWRLVVDHSPIDVELLIDNSTLMAPSSTEVLSRILLSARCA